MDLFSVLLSNAVAASILAAFVAVVCAVVRRPAFASRAWLIVLVKLLVPPIVAVPIMWRTAATLETAEQLDDDGSSTDYVSRTDELNGDAPLLYESTLHDSEPRPTDSTSFKTTTGPRVQVPLPDLMATPDIPESPPNVRTRRLNRSDVRTMAIFIWASGAAVYWLLAAVRTARFRRLLRRAQSPTEDDIALAQDVTSRLGLRTCPPILFVCADVSPMVWSSFSGPRVLLPRVLWQRLNHEQRRAVLAHEFAHIRRGDIWVRWLELLTLGLYWWLPVAWLARRQLRTAEEACCDAWVVWALPGQAPAYAQALVETAASVSAAGAVPLASRNSVRLSSLKRRLTMILQNPPAHRLRWPLALALAAFAFALLPWRPTLAEAQPPAPAGTKRPVSTKPSDPTATSAPKTPASSAPQAKPKFDTGGQWPATVEVLFLEEEVALLEAQLQTRRALYRGAEIELQSQTAHRDEVKRFATQAELLKAETSIEKARVNLDVKAAELKEHELKLTFAKRRLARAQAPVDKSTGAAAIKPDAGSSAADQDRLLALKVKDFEAKVRDLDAACRNIEEDIKRLQAQLTDLQNQRKEIEAQRRSAADRLLELRGFKSKGAEKKPSR